MAPTTVPTFYDGPEITLTAAEDLDVGLRGKIDANGELAIAGAGELSDGIIWGGDYLAGQSALLRRHGHGTTFMIAAVAVDPGDKLFSAANGQVTNVPNNFQEGKAISGGTAAGNFIQAIDQQQDLS